MNFQKNIKVVSQRNLSQEFGWTDIKCDRSSPLGNPFHMVNEAWREPVCEAYKEWLWANIQLHQKGYGFDRVILKPWTNEGFLIATAFKNPSANDVVKELQRMRQMLQSGKKIRLLCWCKQPNREVACHADTVLSCLLWMLKSKV